MSLSEFSFQINVTERVLGNLLAVMIPARCTKQETENKMNIGGDNTCTRQHKSPVYSGF
jgi:hypothetical protein